MFSGLITSQITGQRRWYDTLSSIVVNDTIMTLTVLTSRMRHMWKVMNMLALSCPLRLDMGLDEQTSHED